ncbi:MAG: hypothetical protein WCG94_08325 [Methanothrix sp.]
MMNKYPIVALVLLLAGMALVLNSSGISCTLAGDNSSCRVNGNGSENCICPNGTVCSQNNSSEQNCSALGACPVKAASTRKGCCAGR